MITVEHITKKFVRNKNKKEKEEFYADNDITFEANDGEKITDIKTITKLESGTILQIGKGKFYKLV